VDGFRDAFQCIFPDIMSCVSKMMNKMISVHEALPDGINDDEAIKKYITNKSKQSSAKK
jgi:hypothetical protein